MIDESTTGANAVAGRSGGTRLSAAGIIVAAGRGTRYGASDKVLLPLNGHALLAWVLHAFEASSVAELVIVVGSHTESLIRTVVDQANLTIPARVVIGGDRRQDSVARGVAAVSEGIDLVVIHDAARPLVTASLIDRTIEQALAIGAAIAACPVTDTLKRVRPDLTIEATVAREALWSAQTPQAFSRDALLLASELPIFQDQTFTDEAALFEELGYPVAIVPNNEPNPKVTHPGDLAILEALLVTRARDREASK